MKPSSPPVSLQPAMYPPGLIETAARLNRNYVSWDGLRERMVGDGSALDIWRIMSAIRSATADIVNIGGTVFSWNLTASMVSDLHFIDLRSDPGSVCGGADRRGRAAARREALAEEAISSCLIAGCMISRDKMMKRLREGRPPVGRYEKTLSDTVAMLGRAAGLASEPFSAGLLERMAGSAIRRGGDAVPEPHSREPDVSIYPADRIASALEDMAAFADDDSVHPVVRAFSLEYMVMRVAPLETGNGRAARAAAAWCLERCGYGSAAFLPASVYRNRWRNHYSKAFLTSEAEHDDMTYAISFCLTALVRTAAEASERIEEEAGRLDCLPPGSEDLAVRRRMILSWMGSLDRPVTLKEIASRFQISYQTARTDILRLIEAGFAERCGKEGHKDAFATSSRSGLRRPMPPR